MSEHAERFTGRVEAYQRYRLRYPSMVMEVLRKRCGLKIEDIVADIGAGTGMLAELFLEAGHEVIAVEPNDEMRAVCVQLAERFSGLKVVAASAEATGLPAGSIDLVSVGRAFHWFDQPKALTEFQRILKPGGWVVLLTNRRAKDASEKAAEYEAILKKYGTDYSALRSDFRSFAGLRPYGQFETFIVSTGDAQSLTLDELLGQTQSYSSTPMPGHANYEAMQSALTEFFTRASGDGRVRLDTVCEVIGWQTPH